MVQMNGPPMQQSEKQEGEGPMAAVRSNASHKKVPPSYLKGTASSRSRSQSFDKHNNSSIQQRQQQQQMQKTNNISSRSTNLDPTGMFRNRGRRVITTKSSAAVANSSNNNVATARDSSSTQQMNMIAQNDYLNGQQREQLTVHKAKESIEKNGSGSDTAMVEDGHEKNDNNETNSTEDEIIVETPLPLTQSAATSDETAIECANNNDIEENSHENVNKEGREQSDDESDHGPIRGRDHPNNDSTFDESTDFVPTITLESLKRFEFQDDSSANQLQSLYSRDSKIKRSLSNGSNDSEHSHSAIGSTISVMGSLVGENEGTTIGSFGYDESKLIAVKRRMMQDAEMDENLSDGETDDIRDDEDDRPILATSPVHTNTAVNESMDCNTKVLRDDEEKDVDVLNNVQTDDDANNIKTTNNIHDESPIRAALRRKTQNMANSLPSLPSHLSALTPNRNRLHSSYTKTENAVASGLKVAQQCFSFEDTTVDDSNFLIMPEKLKPGDNAAALQPTHKYYGLSGVASFASEDDESPNTPKRNSSTANNISELPPKLSSSKKSVSRPKWYPPMSGGGTVLSPKVIRHRHVRGNGNSPIQATSPTVYDSIRLSSSFDPSPSSRRVSNKLESDHNEAMTLLRSIVLQSSHTEEIEKDLHSQSLYCESCQSVDETSSSRHDNCQSCLEKMKTIVEAIKRGVIIQNDDNSESSNQEPKFDHQAQCAAIDLLVRSHEYAMQIKQSTLLARKWLESTVQTESSANASSTANNALMHAKEEGLETAESTILSKQEEISRLNNELSKCRAEIGRLKSLSSRDQEIPALTLNKSILSDSSSDNSAADGNNSLNLTSPIPIVKCCDSHDESYIRFEKRIEADMNLENRKEIIFLKAALEKANKKIAALEHDGEARHDKKEPFESEIEAIDASTTSEGAEDMIIQIAKSIENISVESSSLAEQQQQQQEEEAEKNDPCLISLEDPRLEKELEEYRLALIESLRLEESSKSTAAGPSTATAGSDDGQNASNTISSEPSSDKRMINVRMIDGENFTTEWSDLVEPLPPPPDHGLKSPIVDAILSKWTDDSNTRSALIQWIEGILSGEDSADPPSLKLSGLDHQIRDGFIMHVLPLLLLRKDIHVHVTSRAHRQTTYDMAVSISQSVKGSAGVNKSRDEDRMTGEPIHRSKPGGRKHHLMAYQAAHSRSAVNSNSSGEAKDSNIAPFSARQFLGRSAPDIVRTASHTESISTAVTAQISNRTPAKAKNLFRSHQDSYAALSEMKTPTRMQRVPPPALGDDLSVGSSVSEDGSKGPSQSSSIMGSISGAFGGLLSRRKGSQPTDYSDKSASMNSSSWSPSALFTPQSNHSHDELRQDDIYHRVVSAPPGKIGLTFVEYEGNTMVSNVSDSSPLSGWVFPSDVLVAIDDTPVRDLRTRDIVQLLTEKKGQQRNLRMYSLNRR